MKNVGVGEESAVACGPMDQGQLYKSGMNFTVPSRLPLGGLPLVVPRETACHLDVEMRGALLATLTALHDSGSVKAVDEGMGGTYFVKDHRGQCLGVFKPCDEEPMAPNNPKQLQGNVGDMSIKKGLCSGEGAVREVAAYRLDQAAGGVAGVPAAVICKMATSPKDTWPVLREGSYARFSPSAGPSADFATSTFCATDVQAIAILDMRLLNVDRHDGNLLVTAPQGKNQVRRVVPIDHGCIAPASLEVVWAEWAWLDWPGVAQQIEPALRRHVLSLDPWRDAAILRSMGLRKECVRTVLLSTTFLKAVVMHWPQATLRDVAMLMSRDDFDIPSAFERLVVRCRWKVAAALAGAPTKIDFEEALVREVESAAAVLARGRSKDANRSHECHHRRSL